MTSIDVMAQNRVRASNTDRCATRMVFRNNFGAVDRTCSSMQDRPGADQTQGDQYSDKEVGQAMVHEDSLG